MLPKGGNTVIYVLIESEPNGATALAAGIAYPWNMLLTPAFGAALMSLGTVIVAINAKLLERARTLVASTGISPAG